MPGPVSGRRDRVTGLEFELHEGIPLQPTRRRLGLLAGVRAQLEPGEQVPHLVGHDTGRHLDVAVGNRDRPRAFEVVRRQQLRSQLFGGRHRSSVVISSAAAPCERDQHATRDEECHTSLHHAPP